jgi:hypothetical protein
MSALVMIVIVSAILAFTARSLWRQLIEAAVIVMLFLVFVGILTLVVEGSLAFERM